MGGSQDVDGGTITMKSAQINIFGWVRLEIYLHFFLLIC